jgi:hypothetical protein
MMKSFHARRFREAGFALLAVLCLAGLASFSAQGAFSAPTVDDEAALLDGFRHVEVASVSDAIEKLSGQRLYMSHRMRPIFPAKFAGIALTVQLKKEENQDPGALQGMLTAIDQGGPNSVYVMVVEDGVDIAGMVDVDTSLPLRRGERSGGVRWSNRKRRRLYRRGCRRGSGGSPRQGSRRTGYCSRHGLQGTFYVPGDREAEVNCGSGETVWAALME